MQGEVTKYLFFIPSVMLGIPTIFTYFLFIAATIAALVDPPFFMGLIGA
jgi:hypothetical protein